MAANRAMEDHYYSNHVNPTGKAIIWHDADPEGEAEEADGVVRVIIHCFKPLDTY